MTRGQSVLYQLPQDWASIATFLAPALDRIETEVPDAQVLVITTDAEAAAAVTTAAVRLAGKRELVPLAATSARRAARALRAGPAQIVAGTPEELLALVQSATLKLEHLKVVVLAWVDELVAATGEPALETLLGDVPKEAARIIVASVVTPTVEALVERYARRARRAGMAAESATAPIALGYVTVTPSSRLTTLRRMLDELDPSSAIVYVRSDETEHQVREALRALGYGDAGSVRASRGGEAGDTELVILFDVPVTRDELHLAVGTRYGRVVAMVTPRQLTGLAALSGAAVTPASLREAGTRARQREARLRAEVRDVLSSGSFARELLTLEPLLDDHDGIEIAAALLRLLEGARTASRPQTSFEAAPAGAPRAALGMARLFVSVGAMDKVRPGDLVGAITNETGVGREAIGKVEIRDTHSLVEVDAGVAGDVAAKLTGSVIRGRRVQARVDQDHAGRGARREGGHGRGDRGSAPEGQRERGARREFRERSRDRTDRPSSSRTDNRGGQRRSEDRVPRGGEHGPRERRREQE